MRFAVLLALAVFAIGCPGSQVQNAEGDIAFVEKQVLAGPGWPGDVLEAQATLRNRGRSPLTIEWTLPSDGFSFEGLPQTLPSGDAPLTVRFTSNEAGLHEATLVARAGDSVAELLLSAEVKAIPECLPSACHTAAFDKVTETCVETPVIDGESCDPHSVCVLNATCQAGRCVGTPVVCNDGNACTLDTCNALTGCEYPPAPPCPGDGVCQVGVCDPATGCGLAQATDGTICGPVTCDAAQVCISGACVQRDPPDGFVCAEASPCQGAGTCQASACVRPPATTLTPVWSFYSRGGTADLRLHDFVLEPDGNPTFMGFFSSPILRAQTIAHQLVGTARRCILWNGQLACADYDEQGLNGMVVLLDLATAQKRWTFNLNVARPDFAAQVDTMFMARVASMGSDRLAAIFESYPKNSSSGTQCRDYYLVVLDPAGALISATKLSDPLLSQCNHPHPYGVASDVSGNLYLSFSSSANGSAPLAPQYPTLLMSFNRDGVERWRRIEQYVAGELAVANGLLYPEGAFTPHEAATGKIVLIPPGNGQRGTLGRVLASDQLYVPSPQITNAIPMTLSAFSTVTNQPVWTYTLGNDSFLSLEQRAATWTPRPGVAPKELVLFFATKFGTPALTAIDLRTGAEQWSCDYSSPVLEAPQQFELANQKLVVMDGAQNCGNCDPPFANSSASFHGFDTPGIAPSNIAWPGTFGGPGHDHLENGSTLGSPPN